MGDVIKNWYAFHLYRNSRNKFITKIQADSLQYYVAEQVTRTYLADYSIETTRRLLFPSIIFVHCTFEYADSVRRDPYSLASPYFHPGTTVPAPISDDEMQTFMFVLDTGCERMDAIDEKLVKGDKVRVLDGLFKGAEGYIIRIKGDRRFVVSLRGVVAVATTHIPQRFLEKIN